MVGVLIEKYPNVKEKRIDIYFHHGSNDIRKEPLINGNEMDILIRLPRVLEQVGEARSSWYALIQAGKAPSPIKRGRNSLWSQNSINDYIEQLKEA